MVRLLSVFATALFAAGVVQAQLKKECGGALGKCPQNKPCCSQYGQCGVGAFCLGGCDPMNSFKLEACMPAPQCESKTYKFTDEKSSPIVSNTKYLGDPTKADWVVDGQPLFANGVVYLTMAKGTVGTVLASTHYVWYGKITAKFRTSRDQGVVSAFILMSDVKDEIDYEWVGTDLQTSQTNYYWNGIPDYTHSGNISHSGSTYSEWHEYTIDWSPEAITWSIDGQEGRTVKRSDTLNKTSGIYEFPQTPSRVQLSLWPGGLATNGQGTIDWAGGEILWNGEDIDKHGYYFAMISEVTVECYNPPSGTEGSGKKSYKFKNLSGVEDSVVLSNDETSLKSLVATGLDPEKELPGQQSRPVTTVVSTDKAGKATTVVSTAKPTASDDVETVPGLQGAGFGSGDLYEGEDSNGDGTPDSDGSGSGSGTEDSDPSTETGFSQGGSGGGSNSAASSIIASSDRWMIWGNFVAIIMVAAAMATL